MPGSRSSNTETEHKSPRESGEDSEDESEILEESPCGRWLKRKEEVEQRDVPGIDGSHLAMDTEEGVEVVWNEVQFSERKNFKSQEEKIQQVFDNLTQLEHPNIVKFHRYWTDTHNDKPRVIFITEYMSSGSLKQFLKRTKRNVKKLPLEAWKRWCKQILSALSYLHSCSPPIIHGNLTCDTIFIQHNGLVKIGSVAPDAIHHHVKTCRENMKNMHFIAPEYGSSLTHAIDIYSFGMCALEMAALEIQGNGDSGTLVTDEHIIRTIDSLDDTQQKDFIYKCLNKDPTKRPSAKDLLFHPLVFEVHTLKLLAAHCLVNTAPNFSETIIDEMMQRLYKPDVVLADIQRAEERKEYKLADVPAAEKLEKFVEDVKYGIYPLTAYTARLPPPPRPRAISPETAESPKPITPEPLDVETRKVVNMMCSVKPHDDSCDLSMTILLRMDDKMNRQLTCQVSPDDSASHLSDELVHLGFIHETDREKLTALIEDTLYSSFNKQHQLMGSTLMPSMEHHLPVPSYHSASVERSWTVADIDSPGTRSVDGSSTPAERLLQATTTSSSTIVNDRNFEQEQQQQQNNELVQAAVNKLSTTISRQLTIDSSDTTTTSTTTSSATPITTDEAIETTEAADTTNTTTTTATTTNILKSLKKQFIETEPELINDNDDERNNFSDFINRI